MMIQIELWALLTSLAGLAVTLFLWGAGIAKFILTQMDKRLDERAIAQKESRDKEEKHRDEQLAGIEGQLNHQEEAREAGKRHWDSKFSEFDKQLSNHRERIGRLEATAKVSPSHDDLTELHKRINGIATGVSELSGEFKGVNHMLNVIHDFLFNGGKA
jgi:hypothetical protein